MRVPKLHLQQLCLLYGPCHIMEVLLFRVRDWTLVSFTRADLDIHIFGLGLGFPTITNDRYFRVWSTAAWLDKTLHVCELDVEKGIPISIDHAYQLVQQCTKWRDLECGRRLQFIILHNGLDSIALLADYLIRLFASFGSVVEANEAFNKASVPSQYTWNAIIDAHAKLGGFELALELYDRMQELATKPDKFTFLSTLRASNSIGGLEGACCVGWGRYFHQYIFGHWLRSDIVLGGTLIDMYSKCGSLEEACRVFEEMPSKDVVLWNTMIAGYALHEEGHCAINCFVNMQYEALHPSKVTFLSILKACCVIGTIEHGRWIHEQILSSGLNIDIVMGNTLVDMYAKCGNLGEAHRFFHRLPKQDVVSWNAIISGCVQNDECCLALEWFECMQHECVHPTRVTYLSVLKACGNIGAIEQARYMNEQIFDIRTYFDLSVGNTLVDMYGKCGNLEEACRAFNRLPNRDVVSWSTMIATFAEFGEAEKALQCFEDMEYHGIEPTDMVFSGVLSAFSHAGLVDEGLWYFKAMRTCHRMEPKLFHATCLVDLLGRAGCFKEAEHVLDTTMQPDICIWMTLLTSCRMHNNVELGRRCFNEILHLNVTYGAAYVLMSDVYARACMTEESSGVGNLKYARAQKKPLPSCFKANNSVYEFGSVTAENPHQLIMQDCTKSRAKLTYSPSAQL